MNEYKPLIVGVQSGNCTDGYIDNNPGCRACEVDYYRSLEGGYGLCAACPVAGAYTRPLLSST